MNPFLSPYRVWRIFFVCSYVSSVTAMPPTKGLGSPSKYPRRKTCLLIVETHWFLSTEDSNWFQNLDHVSMSPANDSNFIVGNLISCITVGCECGICDLPVVCGAVSPRLSLMILSALRTARFAPYTNSSHFSASAPYSSSSSKLLTDSSSAVTICKTSWRRSL